MMKNIILLFVFTAIISCQNKEEDKATIKPNVLLIMMDDMGYSDLGFMGSRIKTPNIDELAKTGLFYNEFYNAGRCCPSRASLMTGQYAHKVGMGWMTASDLGTPGYAGDLSENCITIAQALKENDYMCYMTGKWHLTHEAYMKKDASNHNWPLQRGFDEFYGHLSGGGSYFTTKTLVENNKWVDSIPNDFYLTSEITKRTLNILDNHYTGENKDKPFFHYLAYYAPHRPLHALKEDIEKYKGVFMMGWDELRKEKYQHLKEVGIIDGARMKLSERDQVVMPWASLTNKEKELWAMKMAVYAAQIDRADQGIGEVLGKLKKYGELDNTLIIFLSDNGGTSDKAGGDLKYNQIETLGTAKTRQSVRKPWSNACNTPFRYYKTEIHEGGISTPLIINWKNGIKGKGQVINQIGHITDLFPTIMDITKTTYPKKNNNSLIINPLQGKSLVLSFTGQVYNRGPVFFEHQGCRGIRDNKYKLVSLGSTEVPYTTPWELYDMSIDRSETNNIAKLHPEIVEKMDKMWDIWAKENDVYPIDNRIWGEKIRTSVIPINK